MEKMLDIPRLFEALRHSEDLWREIFRVPAMSLGVYRLAKGADDPQTPHTEDEAYYVLSGRGILRVGERDHPVGPGTLAFVPARAEHRFHDITEDLDLLVFFAPAEGSGA
jgi:mannose-6-phosphate isomerase-like protein (cupin superfamily)